MRIMYMKSCVADAHSINRLKGQCFGASAAPQLINGLEGKYMLAYDNDKLIGMAAIFDEERCILPEYENHGIMENLVAIAKNVKEKIDAKYSGYSYEMIRVEAV